MAGTAGQLAHQLGAQPRPCQPSTMVKAISAVCGSSGILKSVPPPGFARGLAIGAGQPARRRGEADCVHDVCPCQDRLGSVRCGPVRQWAD
jgi:hypothetical protein